MNLTHRPLREQLVVAVVSVLAAWAINFALWELVRPVTFQFFLTAVIVAAWRGGRMAGLLAILISSLTTTYFFVDPAYSFEVTLGGLMSVCIFVGAGTLVVHVTDQLRSAQDWLEHRNLMLEAVATAVDDPIAVLDRDGVVVMANHAWAERFQLSRGDVVGRDIWDFFPPSRYPDFEYGFRRAARGEVPKRFRAAGGDTSIEVRTVPFVDGLAIRLYERPEMFGDGRGALTPRDGA